MDVPDEYWAIGMKEGAGSFFVTEEVALSVVTRYNNGQKLIEFESIGGVRVFLPTDYISQISSSTRESRDFSRAAWAKQKEEEKESGYFVD